MRAVHFIIDGEHQSLADMQAANADDEAFCRWLQDAEPGDWFVSATGATTVCCAAGFAPTKPELALAVETIGMDSLEPDCAEVRVEERTDGAVRVVSKGRCMLGVMPSLESAVTRALEGAVGGALLAGVRADLLIAVAARVEADAEVWSAAEGPTGRWSAVTRSYPVDPGK